MPAYSRTESSSAFCGICEKYFSISAVVARTGTWHTEVVTCFGVADHQSKVTEEIRRWAVGETAETATIADFCGSAKDSVFACSWMQAIKIRMAGATIAKMNEKKCLKLPPVKEIYRDFDWI